MQWNDASECSPLSSSQQEVWFDQLLRPDTPYNIGGYLRIDGPIDLDRFNKAVNIVIRENDALRTILYPGDPMPVQGFLQDVPDIHVEVHHVSRPDQAHQWILEWRDREFVRPFRLYGEFLFRFALLKVSETCFYFLLTYHHLILDGWSVSLVSQRVASAYNALLEGKTAGDTQRFSYVDFIHNDQEYLQSEAYVRDGRYWQEKYQQLPEPLWPPRHASLAMGEARSNRRTTLALARPLYNRVMQFAADHRCSVFQVILGVWYSYFSRVSNQEEIAIGLPTLNRSTAGFKRTVGMFNSLNPSWFCFSTAVSFVELVYAIGAELRSDYRRQRMPLSHINRQIGLPREGRLQLFDLVLSYVKHDYDRIHFDGSPVEFVSLLSGFEHTALIITVYDYGYDQDVMVYFDYSPDVFDDFEIECLKTRFNFLLGELLRQPHIPLRDLAMMSEEEHHQILVQWNDTATPYPRHTCLHQLVEAQVERTPHAVAIVYDNQRFSYRELNDHANALAHHLRSMGVGPATRVGICMERSVAMVVGLLAILKAGGAYVPLDSSYPEARLSFIINDTQAPVVLTQSSLAPRLRNTQASFVCVDTRQAFLASHPMTNPVCEVEPTYPAYVIYTSGSTGTPKGVSVPHVAINRLVCNTNYIDITPADRIAQAANVSFDAATFEIWSALVHGATLVGIPREVSLIPQDFAGALQGHDHSVGHP